MILYTKLSYAVFFSVFSFPVGKDCKLTYLGLNGNQLTKVPRRLLSRCSNLRHLNLGYNQIAHLDDLALLTNSLTKSSIARLKKLSTLVLRNNPIYSLAFSGTGAGVQNHLLLHSGQHHPHRSHLFSRGEPPPHNPGMMGDAGDIPTTSSAAYHVLPSIPNVFRTEAFPNLYELSLSFCQLSGELEPFPVLPLTNLEISMGLKSATSLTPNMFTNLKDLEWLALDHNSLQSVR